MSVSLESLVPDPLVEPGERTAFGQFFAFLVVGGLGALAFVALSSLFVGLGWVPKWLASTCCYAVLIGPVYLAHRRFSFQSDAPHGRALPRYAGVQMGSLLLASLFSYLTYGLLGLPTLAASLIVTGMTSGVSFAVLRLWAFANAGHLVAAGEGLATPLVPPAPADDISRS